MKQTRNIFIAIITISFLIGCRKDKSVDPTNTSHLIPQELKDYGLFKTGTYWIYQDSISGAIDSEWVWQSDWGIDTLDKDNPYGLEPGTYELFQIKTTSSFFKVEYYYGCNSSWTSYSGTPLFRQKLDSTSIFETICLDYPFTVGKRKYWQNDTMEIAGYYSQLYNFNEVVKILQFNNPTEDHFITDFYYANKFGIIRKEIFERNEIWKLIRYNIIQ
jgi:hypothetical protein